jgi:hypothetical protein
MVWDPVHGIFSPRKSKAKTKSKVAPPRNPAKALDQSTFKPSVKGGGKNKQAATTTSGKPGFVSPEEEAKAFPVGTLVNVAPRVWIGANKTGGIGTVTDYNEIEGGKVYDVKYSLGGREKGIDGRFVTRHDFSGCGRLIKSSNK